MRMKYDYRFLNIDGLSIAEAIAALQTWEAENPDAIDSFIDLGEVSTIEITFQRPMTETEIALEDTQLANRARFVEERDRAEYERLKAKFEGN